MRYSQVVRAVLAAAAADGRTTIPTGVLLAARAADAAKPGAMSSSGAHFVVDGKWVEGPADVRRVLGVAGVRVMSPTMVDTSGVVSTVNNTSRILSDDDYHAAGYELGASNLQYLDQLADLWNDHIAPLGILPDDQVQACLRAVRAGYIVFPETAARLAGFGYPSELQAPQLSADDLDRWNKIAAQWAPSVSAYNKRNLDEAIRQGELSNANADFWSALETAAQAVRDLPATAVEYAGKGAWYALTSLGTKNLVLLGAVALVAGVLILAPRAAAVKTLLKGGGA